ncbi:MAG: methylmalonyl-CoA epimerase [Bdellovibrionaceae bacterium]|nr:methylmalonyl-CoA epimerase [Pseudobdellovibrionaceae bacterium]
MAHPEVDIELDHIGIAVENLGSGFEIYKALGFTTLETEEVPSEKVKVGFIHLGNRANLELLEATTQDSTIRKFLEKRGPGIHHICLRVKDIDGLVRRLADAGVRMIHTEPKMGAHNCRVAFVHPASTGGVLIELSQKMG